jgi:hypothetical protein
VVEPGKFWFVEAGAEWLGSVRKGWAGQVGSGKGGLGWFGKFWHGRQVGCVREWSGTSWAAGKVGPVKVRWRQVGRVSARQAR